MNACLAGLVAAALAGVIHGEVVGPDGPAPGVRVRAYPSAPPTPLPCAKNGRLDRCLCPGRPDDVYRAITAGAPGGAPLAEVQTDKGGRFRLEVDARNVVLVAAGPGGRVARTATELGRTIRLQLAPAAPLSLRVDLPAGLEGRVVGLDDSGAIHVGTRPSAGVVQLGPPEGEFRAVWLVGSGLATAREFRPHSQSARLSVSSARPVRGLVLLDGKPVAGAEVEVDPHDCSTRAVTDAEGRFQVPGALAAPWNVTVHARKDGSFGRAAAAYGELAVVELVPVGSVELTLRGAPAKENVELRWEGRQGEPESRWGLTDAAGKVTFADLVPGSGRVQVLHGWRVEGSDRVTLDAPRAVRATLAVTKGARVEGRVSDPEGQPVEGAQVSALPRVVTRRTREERPWTANTDAAGDYLIDGLAPGAYQVVASHQAWGEQVVAARAPGATRVVFSKQPIVAGTVAGADGAPFVGLLVSLSGGGRHRAVLSDGQGRFRLGAGGDGTFTVGVEDGSGRRASQQVKVKDGASAPVALVFPARQRLEGRVQGPDGKPLAARVSASSWGPFGGRFSSVIEVEAGTDGRFTIATEGSSQLAAWADGLASAEVSAAEAGAGPVVLTLVPRPVAVGRVLDEAGRPVSLFRVEGGACFHPEGRFRYTLRSPGTQSLAIEADGLPPTRVAVKYDPNAREIPVGDVRLEAGKDVRGRVVEARTGQPLGGVSVQAVGAQRGTLTKADGTFVLTAVAASATRVTTSGSRRFARGVAEVNAGGPVTLALYPPAFLEVTVSGASGQPLSGEVQAQGPLDERGAPTRLTQRLDRNGRAWLGQVAAGTWTLKVLSAGAAPVVQALEVRPGQVERPNVRVDAAPPQAPPLPAKHLAPAAPCANAALATLAALEAKGPATAAQGPELLALVHHRDRQVVLRALPRLASADPTAAQKAAGGLLKLYPCDRELRRAVRKLDLARADEPTGCGSPGGEVGSELFASHFELRRWAPAPGSKLVARLERADSAAIAEVVEALGALDGAESRGAAGALAATATPQGFLAALRVARAAREGGRLSVPEFLAGVGGLILQNLGRSSGGEAGAVVGLLAAAGVEDAETMRTLAEEAREHLPELRDAVAAWRGPATPVGRAILEDLSERMELGSATKDSFAILELRRRRDVVALRALVREPARSQRSRAEAAHALAELGDGSGLVLWASRDGLDRQLVDQQRRSLEQLAGAATGLVRRQAQKLLETVWKAEPAR